MNKIFMFVVLILIGIQSSVAQYSEYAVGSLKGAFGVGDMGNATYSVPISVPNGGGFEPQLAVNYNSAMSGYGLFGYGFELYGISVITREGANKFLDGEVKGVTYTSSDNYTLDGKRLILQSGKHSCDGAVYTLYGEPQTMVTFHGTYDEKNPNFWFEVKKINGIVYQYGNTDSSRMRYTNKNGKTHVASWYVNRAEDRHGNVITYNYVRGGLKLYPTSIVYGENTRKSRGISCKVQFNYTTIGNKQLFVIEDTQGSVDRHIASIVVSTNSNVFRRYDFTYDVSGDKCSGRKTRLVSICEQNGNGEKKKPIEICWDNLDALSISRSTVDVTTDFSSSMVGIDSKYFSSADLNGDGVCDIIQIANTKNPNISEEDEEFYGPEYTGVYAYISNSHVSKSTGKITFDSSILQRWYIDDGINFDDSRGHTMFRSQNNGMTICDLDGDGLNDVLFQYCKKRGNEKTFVTYYWIYGKELRGRSNGMATRFKLETESVKSDQTLFFVFDANGDGKDELCYVENSMSGGKYHGKIYKGLDGDVEVIPLTFSFDSTPKKLFSGDFNNDGLVDFIVLCESGYKIYYNNGGNVLKSLFTESNSKVGTNMQNYWRVSPGDFNGDGLSDFVYYHDGDKLSVVFNNGDGTFSAPSTLSGLGTLDRTETKDDDDMFSLYVADFDGDGLSDVMMVTADYEKKGSWLEGYWYDHKSNRIQWFYSTGTGLKLARQYSTTRKDDGFEKNIFTGDFDGDGMTEVANYGGALDGSGEGFCENRFNVYKAFVGGASKGKVVGIKDGLDNYTRIDYEYTTNPLVYTVSEKDKEPVWISGHAHEDSDSHYSPNSLYNGNDVGQYFVKGDEYPVNTYILPIPVVSEYKIVNGCKDSVAVVQSYEDFKCHVAGRGALGFSGVVKNNMVTGEKSVSRVLVWDSRYWLPQKTQTETYLDGKTSYVENVFSRNAKNRTFYTTQLETISQDFDGNVTNVTDVFCGMNGLSEGPVVRYNGERDNMSKSYWIKYDDPDNPSCPTMKIAFFKHTDDEEDFVSCTSYAYDSDGNLIEKAERLVCDDDGWYESFDSAHALVTKYTYDCYGNVLSSIQTGEGVIPITTYNEYDETGRFVVKTYQIPEAAVSTCKYDIWGNLIETSDETNSSNILTTTYEYDGWGRLILKTSPLGISKGYTYKWGDAGDSRKQFYVLEEEGKRNTFMLTGRGEIVWYDYTSPWVKTWYDAVGRETEQETVGLNDTPITRSTFYDNLGRKVRTESKSGILTSSEHFTYDKFQRLVKDSLSTGKLITYTYKTGDDGIKTIATNENGRETVKSYDVWGNLVHVVDAINGTMDYYYNSNGKPSEIHSNGSVVKMEYDQFGNQISLTDPDAGTMTYTYAADGKILKQTDGRGIETVNSYDNLGRVSSTKIGDTVIKNYYGTSGNSKLRLTRCSNGDNFVLYAYDQYGRVTGEINNVAGKDHYECFAFKYSYNDLGQLSKVTYPGNLIASFEYDKYGNKIKTIADGKVICEHVGYDGKEASSLFLGKLTSVSTLDDNGFPSRFRIKNGSVEKDGLDAEFDPLTGNLLSRRRYGSYYMECFDYDQLDRLVGVYESAYGNNREVMTMDYTPDGNFSSKTGIGKYEYNEDFKPHAVIGVENSDALLPLGTLDIVYNSFGKVQSIKDDNTNYSLSVEYGSDMERCYSTLSKAGKVVKTVLYGGDYEKVVENGVTREFYYLDGNTIVVKKDGEFTPYLAVTDHLGSYLAIVDSLGKKVYSASYDAWGKQSVSVNTISFHRGYTGHEMLNEFQLINMNGRLYNPYVGRFLSPDNYVQMPDNTQNFNRYSYCLNNPLKYNDPSGELLTWSFGRGGFSIGLNFGFWGFGINVGYGQNGSSFGVYGEIGPRVGSTGLGSGATVSVSADYHFGNKNITTTVSEGVYASLGVYNASASAFQTWDWNEKEWSKGYSVGFGLGSGDYESGWGINCSCGSNGFDVGIGGYYDSHAWDANPEYEPEKWNAPAVINTENCYDYALNLHKGFWHGWDPGHYSDTDLSFLDINLKGVTKAAIADGKITGLKKPNFWNKLGFGRKGYYSVYLVVDNGIDYHWFRQDKGGYWSHKPGRTPVKNLDASGKMIKNPAKADVGNYKDGGILLWVKKR